MISAPTRLCRLIITISIYRPHFHRQITIYQSIQSYHTASAYARKVPAGITVGTETFYEYLAFCERRFLYLIQRLCYSVRYRLGVGFEVVVKQAVVAVVGYEADLGEAAWHIRAAVDEIVLSVLAREAGLNAPVFGYPGGGERVTDVLRERGVLGRRVRMNPYFNAVRVLRAVAVERDK